jgi:hypothetical protein
VRQRGCLVQNAFGLARVRLRLAPSPLTLSATSQCELVTHRLVQLHATRTSWANTYVLHVRTSRAQVYGERYLSWVWVDTGSEAVTTEVVRLSSTVGTPVRSAGASGMLCCGGVCLLKAWFGDHPLHREVAPPCFPCDPKLRASILKPGNPILSPVVWLRLSYPSDVSTYVCAGPGYSMPTYFRIAVRHPDITKILLESWEPLRGK